MASSSSKPTVAAVAASVVLSLALLCMTINQSNAQLLDRYQYDVRRTLCKGAARTCGWKDGGAITLACLEGPDIPCINPLGDNWEASLSERAILQSFQDSIKYVGPEGGGPFTSWDNQTSHCLWSNVQCEGGRVIGLFLGDSYMSGSIPPEFSALQRIAVLDLRSNFLTGTIPPQYSLLRSLKQLRLSGNALSGSMPPQLSTLKALDVLEANHVLAMDGPLPPEYSELTNLTRLHLPGDVVGTLPRQWSTLTSLLSVRVAQGLLTGTLPAEYSTWKRLRLLNLESNVLTGTLPATYSTLTNANSLHLSGNRFVSPLPSEWSAMGSAMSTIALTGSRVEGSLPTEWSSLEVLRKFYLLPEDVVQCPIDGRTVLETLPPNVRFALQAAGFQDPCPRADESTNQALVAVIAVCACLGFILLIIPVACGIVVIVHRSTCDKPGCPHRHPGAIHSLAGHFGGLRVQTRHECKWCCVWNGNPDLEVDYKEIEPFMTDKYYIASGSFGRIYRAEWRGQDVAIKELMGGNQDSALDAFKEEVDACIRYNESPSFVHLVGASLKPPRLFLLTEFMTGGTLEERIYQSEKPMSYVEVLHCTRHIAAGLQHLHPTYVHRDLKPANILLDTHGCPKITDLGLAHSAGNALDTQMATDAAGTAAYMAPEQHDGAFTTKMDIYALGIIMNECLTRKLPFSSYKGSIAVAIAVAERGERPSLPEALPRRAAKLIKLMWAQDPNLRPSASELTIMLDSLIKDEACSRISSSTLKPGGTSKPSLDLAMESSVEEAPQLTSPLSEKDELPSRPVFDSASKLG